MNDTTGFIFLLFLQGVQIGFLFLIWKWCKRGSNVSRPDLLVACEQIKILNAGKDNDIEWLCRKAIDKLKAR